MNTLSLTELTAPPPDPGPWDWNDEGVVKLDGFIPDHLIDAYEEVWKYDNGFHRVESNGVLVADRPGGYPDCAPFTFRFEILDLVAPLEDTLRRLTGDTLGVNLNLTGWVTTTRDWHQDGYLNEVEVGDWYAAVWIALGDVHPDSGPFQYVPGSHRWPQVTRNLIECYLDITDPLWPTKSEAILSPLFTAEIERRNAEVVTHLPKRGDVLIWHSRLLHRGSIARVPGHYRPGFIAHFSGIHHRPQMPAALPYWKGGWYFPVGPHPQTSSMT